MKEQKKPKAKRPIPMPSPKIQETKKRKQATDRNSWKKEKEQPCVRIVNIEMIILMTSRATHATTVSIGEMTAIQNIENMFICLEKR